MANEVISITFKVDDKGVVTAEKNVEELEKQVKETDKEIGKLAKGMKTLGGSAKILGAGIAAVGTSVLALGKFTLDSAREIDQLTKLSGLSAEAFQRQAFAAKSVGIESDKYADIIKDVNDKVGDFMTTGAGPMKDFFDTVGKKVGVTAEQFKGLSGDQALGLYVDTLQKAGANQQEVAFHMEALASDATLLVPLLANGATEMNRLGDAAGNVLSAEQVAQAKQLNEQFDMLQESVGNQLKNAFMNVAVEAGKFFNLLGTEQQKLVEQQKRQLDKDIGNLKDSLAALRNNEIDALSKEYADLNMIEADRWAIGKDIADQERDRLIPILEAKIKMKEEEYWKTIDLQNAANAQADAEREITDAIRERGFAKEPGGSSGTSVAQTEAETKAEEEKADAAEKAADALKKQNAELNAQKEKWLDLADPSREHKRNILEVQNLLIKGKITAEEYRDVILAMGKGKDGESEEGPFQGLIDELTSLETAMKQMKTDAVVGLADGFAEMAVSGKSNFKEMAASMLKDIAKLIIKTLILRAAMAFLNSEAAGPLQLPQVPAGGAANGGIIGPGQASFVGERGMEIIQPAAQSRVIPNHAMRMGGGNAVNVGSINVNIQEREGETSEEQAQRIGKAIRNEMRGLVITELNNQSRQGNMLNPNPIKAFR